MATKTDRQYARTRILETAEAALYAVREIKSPEKFLGNTIDEIREALKAVQEWFAVQEDPLAPGPGLQHTRDVCWRLHRALEGVLHHMPEEVRDFDFGQLFNTEFYYPLESRFKNREGTDKDLETIETEWQARFEPLMAARMAIQAALNWLDAVL